MSEQKPIVVVLPSQAAERGNHANENQESDKIAHAIEKYLHGKDQTHEKPPIGPLKEIFNNQDSLYKYINWEDPVRSLGTFVAALSIMFGAHYIPITPWLLKLLAMILGLVSVTEGVNRVFGPDTILKRLRPMEYKTIPEPTLNATLHDIHDFLQVAVVQAQRILYGEDLNSAFFAFVGTTTLYWLLKIASPFWLAILGLVSLYTAPLVSSVRGRKAVMNAKQRSGELTRNVAEQSKTLAHDGKIKADQLSAKASNVPSIAKDYTNNLVSSATDGAYQLASGAQNVTSNAANNTSRLFNSATGKTQAQTGSDSYTTPRSAHSHLESGFESLPQDSQASVSQNVDESADIIVKHPDARDLAAIRALEKKQSGTPLPATLSTSVI